MSSAIHAIVFPEGSRCPSRGWRQFSVPFATNSFCGIGRVGQHPVVRSCPGERDTRRNTRRNIGGGKRTNSCRAYRAGDRISSRGTLSNTSRDLQPLRGLRRDDEKLRPAARSVTTAEGEGSRGGFFSFSSSSNFELPGGTPLATKNDFELRSRSWWRVEFLLASRTTE